MDGWDIALWSVAAYLAVVTLVRFMAARRSKVLDELRQRAAAVQASRPAAVKQDEAEA